MDRSNADALRFLVPAVALLLAVALPDAAHADPWETIRKGTIDPVNTSLHRHLPRAIQSRDLEAILAFYRTETGTGVRWSDAATVYGGREEEMQRWSGDGGEEKIRDRYHRLLDLFETIDKAEVRIHRVHWAQGDETGGLPAEVRLIVRGTRPDGAFAQLDQRARLRIARGDSEWQILVEEVTGRELVTRSAPRFSLATEAAGISNVHTNESSPVFRLVGGTAASSGSAVADVDRDGCEDFFLAGSPDAALYRNGCDGRFRDVTERSGLPRPYPAAASGAVFFDYDNDGWPDLYVAAIRGGDRLFHNRGDGRFEDVTAKAGISAGAWASMPVVADYDRDGDLDVCVIRMGDHEKTAPSPNYEAENGVPNTLYRNDGDGSFTDVSEEAGVADSGWGLAGAWGDFDDDGWPDLYVGNEFGLNTLYRNDGDGTFTEVAREARADDRGAAMGLAWGDYDGDGHFDVFVNNMYANSRWALFHPEFPVPAPWWARTFRFLFPAEFRRRSDEIIEVETRGSTLLRNAGDGTFHDASDAAGVRDTQWGWSAEFLDYDNDGRLDLYAVNGFITGELPDDV